LDIAQYDLRLEEAPGTALLNSFTSAVKRGVVVRLMFNQDHAQTIPVPPPPEIDWAFVDRLRSAGVHIKPVPGVPDLMHHKYVVRDGGAVLTGSANWTNDSWNREENVVLTVGSGEIAAEYAVNFQGLWDNPIIAASGRDSCQWSTLAEGARFRSYIYPGRSLRLLHAMSLLIASAKMLVRVSSPVFPIIPILAHMR